MTPTSEPPAGRGYSIHVEGPVYQRDDDGVLRQADGIDPSRPWYWIPGGDDTGQGDEPAELGPGWRDVGLYTPAEQGIPVDVEEVRRTAEAIEVLATLPERHRPMVEHRLLDGVSIAEHRPVPRPERYSFHLPSALGGLPEPEDGAADPNEPVRYVANRAERRRLARRRGRP